MALALIDKDYKRFFGSQDKNTVEYYKGAFTCFARCLSTARSTGMMFTKSFPCTFLIDQ